MSLQQRKKSPIKTFIKFFIGIILAYSLINWFLGKLPKNIQHSIHIDIDDSNPDSSFYTDKIPLNYLDILNLKSGCCTYTDTGKFHLDNTTLFVIRQPVSSFIYNKVYYVQITQLDSSYNNSLKSSVIEGEADVVDQLNSYYSEDNTTKIKFLYKSTSRQEQVKPNKIYLNLNGKSTHPLILNDSIVDYYSEVRKFSIQYNLSKKYEIYGSSRDDSWLSKDYQPFEILFLERKHKLYLLTASIYYYKTMSYNPGMLYNLIKR